MSAPSTSILSVITVTRIDVKYSYFTFTFDEFGSNDSISNLVELPFFKFLPSIQEL